MKIILASASPTRKKLLKKVLDPLGLDFETMPSEIDEGIEGLGKISRKETEKKVVELAQRKAAQVWRRLGKIDNKTLLVAADTLIWFQEQVYGKPKDLRAAFEVLKSFRGKRHWAFTGLVLWLLPAVSPLSRQGNTSEVTRRGSSDGGGPSTIRRGVKIGDDNPPPFKEIAICAKAKVYMKNISDQELRKYVVSGEPLGKAGSYGILQKAGKFMKTLSGEPETVAGLPVRKLGIILREKFGL